MSQQIAIPVRPAGAFAFVLDRVGQVRIRVSPLHDEAPAFPLHRPMLVPADDASETLGRRRIVINSDALILLRVWFHGVARA